VLPLRVGNDVATIDGVMGVIEILSSRREYTKLNPFVVLLGKGEHQITSSWTNPSKNYEHSTMIGITRSNITFIGTGKDTTTILGGFAICDLENITFKNMNVTNTSSSGRGIHMRNAKVELTSVALKGCSNYALGIPLSSSETILVATRCEFANSSSGAVVNGSLTSATFKNCVFHDNSSTGIWGGNNSTIHLHGDTTAIHSNGEFGIWTNGSKAKVLIHLPSQHNTSYNNGQEDRHTFGGGTITNVED